MRLLELEIEHVRGVRDLVIVPDGANFVIYGPNGSGKSAVVDAVDFLLTGRMSRLTGPGTGGITLQQHGPHVDRDAAAAVVRARVRLPGVAESVQIERCIADPEHLRFEEHGSVQLRRVIEVALRGQHMMTRRHILRYITSEPRTRAQNIQALLDASDIEDIRQSLVSARNSLKKEAQSAAREAGKAEGAINSTTGESSFDMDTLVELINKHRSTLAGGPIKVASARALKKGVKTPAMAGEGQRASAQQVKQALSNLGQLANKDTQTEMAEIDDELRTALAMLRSSPDAVRALHVLELTLLGIDLIDETGRCPLCETEWPPGELSERLQERVRAAGEARVHFEKIASSSRSALGTVDKSISSLQGLIQSVDELKLGIDVQSFGSWLQDLEDLAEALENPVDAYPDDRFVPGDVCRMLAPADAADQLAAITTQIEHALPRSTPQQDAWDCLTRLEENLKQLEAAEKQLDSAKDALASAQVLLDVFVAARDEVLCELYDQVRDRFVEFYRALHGEDESDFTATIEPQDAGLVFEVDFYGRGAHAPHALHSEGHQDSMGLCLYLALAEHLTAGVVDLIMLDDVVMSVDSGHRRRLCELLGSYFPNRQFLITTHDKTWANQLRASGVVEARSMLEFYNWHVETGPLVNYEPDMWQRIETALENDEIDVAAGLLRRGAEHFFALVCDAFGAQVRYTLDHREELGDLLPGAMSRYRKLLRRAKKAAQSWGNQDGFEELQAIDSVAGEVYARSGAEQWAVNAAVHYNSWASFSPGDFRPVVDAFRDLYGLFICPGCGGMLYLAKRGHETVGLRCNCAKVNWSLVQRVARQ